MNAFRSALFRRYLISYIAVFLLPVAVMGTLFYLTAVVDVQRQAEATSLAGVHQIRELVEQRMTELDAIAARIYADRRLTPYWLQQGSLSRVDAVHELGRYNAGSSFIGDLFFVPFDQALVFSSGGVLARDRFFEHVAVVGDWSADQFRDRVLNAAQPHVYPAQSYRFGTVDSSQALVSVYPIPPRSPHPFAAIVYTIPDSRFTSLMMTYLGNHIGLVGVFDGAGTLLTASANGLPERFDQSVFWQHVKSEISEPTAESSESSSVATGSVATVSHQGRDYSVVRARSTILGWQFVAAIRSDQFFGRVVRLRNLLVTVVGGLSVLGFAIGYRLSLTNYSPIKRLAEFVAGRRATDAVCQRPDRVAVKNSPPEIIDIQTAIGDAYRTRDRLVETIEHQRPLVRAQVMSTLLRGTTDEYLKWVVLNTDIRLPHGCFFVMMISLCDTTRKSVWEREMAVQAAAEFGDGDFTAFGVEPPDRDELAVVVNCVASDDARSLQQRAVAMLQEVPTFGRQADVALAVGLVHRGAGGVARSYLEAAAAFEYFEAEGRPRRFFADIGRHTTADRLPLQAKLRLVQAVKEGAATVVTDTLSEIAAWVAAARGASEAVAADIRDVETALLDIPRSLGLTIALPAIGAAVSASSAVPVVPAVMVAAPQPTARLAALADELCRQIGSHRGETAGQVAQRIIAFIHDNYRDRNLGLAMIADRFSMSLSHLSRLVKEQTGKTFSEYLGELRIQRMMLLLRSTDLSVKDIVGEVGYQDVANCIRKFRQEVGTTPGRYRQQAAPVAQPPVYSANGSR